MRVIHACRQIRPAACPGLRTISCAPTHFSKSRAPCQDPGLREGGRGTGGAWSGEAGLTRVVNHDAGRCVLRAVACFAGRCLLKESRDAISLYVSWHISCRLAGCVSDRCPVATPGHPEPGVFARSFRFAAARRVPRPAPLQAGNPRPAKPHRQTGGSWKACANGDIWRAKPLRGQKIIHRRAKIYMSFG